MWFLLFPLPYFVNSSLHTYTVLVPVANTVGPTAPDPVPAACAPTLALVVSPAVTALF